MTPGTRVTVLWLDASFDGDLEDQAEKIAVSDLPGQLSLTAGFWVGEDQYCVAISQDWYPYETPQRTRAVYRIPQDMVIEIHEEKTERRIRRKKSFRPPRRTV